MNTYQCWHKDRPEWSSRINAVAPHKARYEYYRDFNDAWPCHYIDIRCRKVGGPYTSEQFLQNASYRGIPWARCGQKVKVEGHLGLIAGHNSSANLDIYFLEGPHKGLTVNCHPGWMMIICIEEVRA